MLCIFEEFEAQFLVTKIKRFGHIAIKYCKLKMIPEKIKL
jgi:hypothetical protein